MNNYIVEDFKIENTGGNIYIAWGSFTNGTYFAIGEDLLLIYDEDEYKAMSNENYDGYTWEQEHIIESFANCKEVKESYDIFMYVLKQVWDKCTFIDKSFLDLFSEIEGEE